MLTCKAALLLYVGKQYIANKTNTSMKLYIVHVSAVKLNKITPSSQKVYVFIEYCILQCATAIHNQATELSILYIAIIMCGYHKIPWHGTPFENHWSKKNVIFELIVCLSVGLQYVSWLLGSVRWLPVWTQSYVAHYDPTTLLPSLLPSRREAPSLQPLAQWLSGG